MLCLLRLRDLLTSLSLKVKSLASILFLLKRQPGKDTYEIEDIVRQEVGMKNAGIGVTESVGENLVELALLGSS